MVSKSTNEKLKQGIAVRFHGEEGMVSSLRLVALGEPAVELCRHGGNTEQNRVEKEPIPEKLNSRVRWLITSCPVPDVGLPVFQLSFAVFHQFVTYLVKLNVPNGLSYSVQVQTVLEVDTF